MLIWFVRLMINSITNLFLPCSFNINWTLFSLFLTYMRLKCGLPTWGRTPGGRSRRTETYGTAQPNQSFNISQQYNHQTASGVYNVTLIFPMPNLKSLPKSLRHNTFLLSVTHHTSIFRLFFFPFSFLKKL